MAISPLQIPSSNINNLVDQSQWSSLANLGNVYKQAQEDAAKQNTLSQLGNDPAANASLLVRSGVPSLAQLGLTMQSQQSDRAERVREWEAANRRAEAGETRTAADYAKKGEDEEAAAKSVESFWRNRTTPQAAAPDPAFTQGASPIVPSPAVPQAPPPSVAQPPVVPPMQQTVPLAPGQVPPDQTAVPLPPQAPPPIAPSPNAPSQLQATGAMTPQPPAASRVATSLLSGNPAAAAGITPEEMGEMYRNPETRELAKVFLQNATKPGTWKVNFDKDTGQVTAYDERDPAATIKNITPPTPGGQAPMSKEERERQSIYDDAIKSGYSKDAANFMKFNKGKPPSENMTPAEIKSFNDLSNTARTADIFVNNLKQMQKLSANAYEGYGAQQRADLVTGALGDNAPQAALDTQNMAQIAKENAALQLRSTFGSRPAAIELKYLQDLESNPFMPRSQRQNIYTRLIDRFSQFRDEDQQRAQAIQQGTLYKKGPGATGAPTPTPAPAPAPTAPAQSDDLAAAKWARDNPNDPRAQQIMQHLRGQ